MKCYFCGFELAVCPCCHYFFCMECRLWINPEDEQLSDNVVKKHFRELKEKEEIEK